MNWVKSTSIRKAMRSGHVGYVFGVQEYSSPAFVTKMWNETKKWDQARHWFQMREQYEAEYLFPDDKV